jgi:hypothetical protein
MLALCSDETAYAYNERYLGETHVSSMMPPIISLSDPSLLITPKRIAEELP